jgi:hypothetical protein
LILSFVVFDVFRFIGITQKKAASEGPTDSMLRDAPFLINLLGYAMAIVAIIDESW